MFRDIISDVGKQIEEKKGLQQMSLQETTRVRDFLVKESREMAILKKRFDTVNKTRQPVWYNQFEKVLKQKMYDEILITMRISRHSL
jgi:hypothetical protein